MPLYETESLVLKSYNLAEADRIVLLFTREYGLVRAVAKGAKRLKSRFGSTLEPFSTVHLTYFQKEDRELVSIQNIELLSSSFEQASSPSYLQTFSYVADLLSSFLPPHDPNETLYRMVKACVGVPANTSEDLAAVRLYFEVWLLRLGGFLPNWDTCDVCKRALDASESADVQADFSLLCSGCRKTWGGSTVSGIHREIFRRVQKLAPTEFIEFANGKIDEVLRVSGILKRIIGNVIGKEVASEKSFALHF
ncbi:MAG TPA: DNA repair protein RecO [Pyrinomonadaceae bacterium]